MKRLMAGLTLVALSSVPVIVIANVPVTTPGTVRTGATSISSVPTDQQKAAALQVGVKHKGKLMGLALIDQQQGVANALMAFGGGAAAASNMKSGFSIRVYTPITWIQQLSANAAKLYAPLPMSGLTDEMTAPVLRVIVSPDKPFMLTGAGMSGASSVEHVIIQDEKRETVLQPLTEEPFVNVLSSARRDAMYDGVVATFPLDELQALRGSDKEFYVVVVGNGTREKRFKIKSKHFEDLP